MKTMNIIENANNTLKNVAKELRNANKEYTGICSVLKDIQRNEFLKAGYREVFAAVGVDVDAVDESGKRVKLTPATFFSRVHESMYGTDKKGEKYVGIWGNKKNEDGTTTPVLRKVTAWTPRKVFVVLAQSIEAAK